MKFRIQAVMLTAIILTLLYPVSGRCLTDHETTLQKVDELLTLGENLRARESLQKLSAEGSDHEAVLWRMARVHYEMGRLVDSEQKALLLFQEAERYARQAISAAPEDGDGYKWLAIALGAQSKYINTKTQVKQSREIKESIEKAIALAPEDDIAYLVLSRWHYKVSGLGFFARTFAKMIYGELPEASLKEAEKLLWQAIGLHDRISHRYNLYKVYDRMKRSEDAKLQLEKALLLPATFPEELEKRDKARRKLKKMR